MKASSYHPHRGKRQASMPTGMDPVPAGSVPPLKMGGPSYNTGLDRTQPKDRSGGIRRVKTYAQQKGL